MKTQEKIYSQFSPKTTCKAILFTLSLLGSASAQDNGAPVATPSVAASLATIEKTAISSSGASSADEKTVSTKKEEALILEKPIQYAAMAYDTLNDDIANLISGKEPNKYFKNKMQNGAWKSHRKNSASEWQSVYRNKVTPIRKWMDKKKFTEGLNSNTLFYPFAGADFLYASAFFKNVDNYVLVGLEPLGHLKNPETMDADETRDYVQQIRVGMVTANNLGFFRTESMKKDFKQEELDGTVHLVVWYLKRLGYRIQNLSYFKLDAQGVAQVHNDKDFKNASGYRIDFFGADGKVKHLAYLSVDLSDGYLAKHPEYMNYFNKFPNHFLLLKSASYLLQYGYFSQMRNFVLKNANLVVQDDSGIPYKYLKNWDLKLFGTYTKTLNMFKERFQPDLKEAMDHAEKRVPFRIGYNLHHNEMTLMVAKQK